jgi:hypothetical protein
MDDEDEFVDAVDGRDEDENLDSRDFRAEEVDNGAGFDDDDFGDFAEQEESDADDGAYEEYDPEAIEAARKAEQVRIEDTSNLDQPTITTGKRPIVHHVLIVTNERNSSISLISRKNKFDEKYSTF